MYRSSSKLKKPGHLIGTRFQKKITRASRWHHQCRKKVWKKPSFVLQISYTKFTCHTGKS